MEYYAGIDVSLESASVCIVDDKGTIVREGKAASEPAALCKWLKDAASELARIGLEAGPLPGPCWPASLPRWTSGSTRQPGKTTASS